MSWALNRVTAPTTRPVSVQDVKNWGKIDTDADDALIQRFCLDPAIAYLDGRDGVSGLALEQQTWDLKLDAFPCGAGAIRVPLPPLISVTSISYVDEAGNSQTLSASRYRVDTASRPGRIEIAYGDSWPSARSVVGAVAVRFVCGHALAEGSPTESGVPDNVKMAVIALALHYYENRARIADARQSQVPRHVEAMIDAFRVRL